MCIYIYFFSHFVLYIYIYIYTKLIGGFLVPDIPVSTIDWLCTPQHGEVEKLMVLQSNDCWKVCPAWMRSSVVTEIGDWNDRLSEASVKLAKLEGWHEGTAKPKTIQKKMEQRKAARCVYERVVSQNPQTLIFDMTNGCLVGNTSEKPAWFLAEHCAAVSVKMDMPFMMGVLGQPLRDLASHVSI